MTGTLEGQRSAKFSPPAGVLPRPCLPKILARTTFVLESLLQAKNPGQDAIFGDCVFQACDSVGYYVIYVKLLKIEVIYVIFLF